MTSNTKIFTVKEANQTLPLVRRIVADILATGSRIRELTFEKGREAQDDLEVNELLDRLDEHFEELEELGCMYKDWNFTTGLVDFPAVLNGREVLLCWRTDEPSVAHYHDLDAGYPGRKPIPAELLAP